MQYTAPDVLEGILQSVFGHAGGPAVGCGGCVGQLSAMSKHVVLQVPLLEQTYSPGHCLSVVHAFLSLGVQEPDGGVGVFATVVVILQHSFPEKQLLPHKALLTIVILLPVHSPSPGI